MKWKEKKEREWKKWESELIISMYELKGEGKLNTFLNKKEWRKEIHEQQVDSSTEGTKRR